jgi:hypothetical protein
MTERHNEHIFGFDGSQGYTWTDRVSTRTAPMNWKPRDH